MRITTWNCARGPFAIKRTALDHLESDIVVLTEAPRPKAGDSDVHWFGKGSLGIAMYAARPFTIHRTHDRKSTADVYPVAVRGPVSFTLVGVWTHPTPNYRKPLLDGLAACARCPGPWVVAGDFNGNVKFDTPRRKASWRQCFDTLGARGLVSAYHEHTGIALGHDAELPTHYFQWKRDRPFHLDYCLVPRIWRIEAVTIGSYDDWATLSDHRPVTVDVVPG